MSPRGRHPARRRATPANCFAALSVSIVNVVGIVVLHRRQDRPRDDL